jgi:hypothetical protein
MTNQQLLTQLKTLTQAGRYSYLQKVANTKLLKQAPPSSK